MVFSICSCPSVQIIKTVVMAIPVAATPSPPPTHTYGYKNCKLSLKKNKVACLLILCVIGAVQMKMMATRRHEQRFLFSKRYAKHSYVFFKKVLLFTADKYRPHLRFLMLAVLSILLLWRCFLAFVFFTKKYVPFLNDKIFIVVKLR